MTKKKKDKGAQARAEAQPQKKAEAQPQRTQGAAGAALSASPTPRLAGRIAPAAVGCLVIGLGFWEKGPLGFLPVTAAVFVAGVLALPWLRRAAVGLLPAWADGKRAKLALEVAGLAVVFGTFFLLKVIGVHPSTTDENIYFYMAARFSQGALPYRDFFFAHPPMHLVVPAAVFAVTGFHIAVAKMIPVTAALVYGAMFYLTLRRAAGRGAALLGLAGLLTAYQVLMASTDMTGVNLTLMFLSAAVFCAVIGRPLASGILAGLAMSTGMYSFAGVAGLALALLVESRRRFLWFIGGFAATFALVMGIFWGIGAQSFVDGVFVYHFRKLEKIPGWESPFQSWNPFAFAGAVLHNTWLFLGGKVFKQSFYFHAPLYLALTAAAAMGTLRALAALFRGGIRELAAETRRLIPPQGLLRSPAGYLLFSLAAVLLFVFQWANLKEVYDFYLLVMLFFVPVSFGLLGRLVLRWSGEGILRRAAPAAAGALLLLWVQLPLSLWLEPRLWASEKEDRGKVITYQWRDPSAFASLSRATKGLFFRDRRTVGEYTPHYRHYIWNKMTGFATVEEIAGYVKARTAPGDTIAGASSIAPLVALYAGRRVADDEADTNGKRFSSGMLKSGDYFAGICASPSFKFFLAAPRAYFGSRFMQSDPFASKAFTLEKSFYDPAAQFFSVMRIDLYKVREPGCGLGPP